MRAKVGARAQAPLAFLGALLLGSLPLCASAQSPPQGGVQGGVESGVESPERLLDRGYERLRSEGGAEQALELFRRAFALERSPRAAAQMGLAEAHLERWEAAEAHLLLALDHPEDGWVRDWEEALRSALAEVRRQRASAAAEPAAAAPAATEPAATEPAAAAARGPEPTSLGLGIGALTLAAGGLALTLSSWILLDGFAHDPEYSAHRARYPGQEDVCAVSGADAVTRICSEAPTWEALQFVGLGLALGGSALGAYLLYRALGVQGQEAAGVTLRIAPSLSPRALGLRVEGRL